MFQGHADLFINTSTAVTIPIAIIVLALVLPQ
jgi:hypothetical protein